VNSLSNRTTLSLKHEVVYLKGYAALPELLLGLTEYFMFYNMERTHQSLDYCTPIWSIGQRAVAEQAL
jgi:putative transposase